ncbi:MAG: hypothetical protein ABEJ96_03305 [Thiohalorhabdaceae bacterium]
MDPALAVGMGGVAGVVGGVLFFRGVRRFAKHEGGKAQNRSRLVIGLAWRLAGVGVLLGAAAGAGGQPGALAVLGGLVLARLVVRRGSG